MADTVAITAGSGTVISTDERTINSTAQHVQRIVPLGGSTIANAHVTVTNSATEIRAATETQQRTVIANFQTVPVYVGAATVTTSAGFRLDPGASLTLHTAAAVEGITSAAYTAAGEDDKVHVISEVSA
jgi:hypothetical protein